MQFLYLLPTVTSVCQKASSLVGVFLDFDGGVLSFVNVANSSALQFPLLLLSLLSNLFCALDT